MKRRTYENIMDKVFPVKHAPPILECNGIFQNEGLGGPQWKTGE